MAKKSINQIIKKIPGYHSGNFNKILISTVLYALAILILLTIMNNPIRFSSLKSYDTTPLAVEWLIVAILSLLAVFIHLKKKWKR